VARVSSSAALESTLTSRYSYPGVYIEEIAPATTLEGVATSVAIFAIAAVINDFSDRVVRNQTIIDANAELHQWHTEAYKTRLPGLKWNLA
jgi:hypothetical protein